MKQYKHKITGNLATETSTGKNYRVTMPQNFTVPKWIIENSCDWEEIIVDKAPEYEIMSFEISKNSRAGRVVDGKGNFTGCYGIHHTTLEKALEKWPIHSIKRNSDGKTFTKDDRIDADVFTNAEILGFKLEEHYSGKIWITTLYGDTPLHLVKPSKGLPILYTEDNNVPIYEGDEYWWCHLPLSGNIYGGIAGCAQAYDTLRFSTKQAAEDYIAKNKVLFVTEDGIEIKNGDAFYVVNMYNLVTWRGTVENYSTYGKNYLMYSSLSKAQEYINENKPMYSKKQIDDILIQYLTTTYREDFFDKLNKKKGRINE